MSMKRGILLLILAAVLVAVLGAGGGARAAKCVPLEVTVLGRQVLRTRPCVPCPDNFWVCTFPRPPEP
jgi:hypothetical protein